ncbi:MAG TPA: N-methyl-D-aspartate receptor NMDAR2C subunit [Candidatus Binatia bacterium]|nr:N-methyl-D-aspartate receptor NMDAR2C subunit [Candidatus Binatia bacterium]
MCQRLGIQPETKLFHELVRIYSHPSRAYHNVAHIRFCLIELEQVPKLSRLTESYATIEFALWHHDAVYDPKASDNEERSAELARKNAQELGLSQDFQDKITHLILCTKHQSIPQDLDGQIITDLDLAILGRPEPEFKMYERQIRREYKWVDEVLFSRGRAGILKLFLSRKQIYSTLYFNLKYEDQARKNLQASLDHLASYA